MYIEKLKVRPRKSTCSTCCVCRNRPELTRRAAVPFNPCVAELSTMLSCWTAKGDLQNTGACAETAKMLFDCMRTTVRLGLLSVQDSC